MQVWFRVEAQPLQPTNVFGNLVPESSSGNFANLYYSDGATEKFGLMLTYEDESNRGNVSIDGNSADALDIDRWYHLAVQRDVENGVIRIFVDGVARASSGRITTQRGNHSSSIFLDAMTEELLLAALQV